VLTEELGALVGGLSFAKSMRWNGAGAAFSRPVRWLLGLHGAATIPFSFAGLRAGARNSARRCAGIFYFLAVAGGRRRPGVL